ncbi:hypothetical protein HMPREF3227_00656 [Corynebacterium sp. CMW7794]|nr:hypothetical protein HMPREF0307_00518 [Corynebacterium sp. DNF00584]KXI19292.1 hypothetical protein HMPREF3227_00656 [Corynebacterium sp. CMW7794]
MAFLSGADVRDGPSCCNKEILAHANAPARRFISTTCRRAV